MSYQELTLIGHLGRDPEMSFTPGGQAVTKFPVAVNRRVRNALGEQVRETAWFQITAWERQAENANLFLQKGSQVMVKGRLTPDPGTGSPRLWQRRDGSLAASYEVTAQEIIYLSRREGTPAGESTHADGIEIDIPF